MKPVHDAPKRAYINVMELLVAEEVEKQVKVLPPRVLKYLRAVEVETYALNRLPALYASSEKGWQHQYEKAKRELNSQIKGAVRQALAAVQVDPIRTSEPLALATDEAANGALDSLRALLKQPELSWDGVVNRLKVILSNRSGEALEPNLATSEASHRTRYRQGTTEQSTLGDAVPPSTHSQPNGDHPRHWRPGTYGAEVSWQKTHDHNPKPPEFDWSDPRYSK